MSPTGAGPAHLCPNMPYGAGGRSGVGMRGGCGREGGADGAGIVKLAVVVVVVR